MKLKTLWITIVSLLICAGLLGFIVYETKELNQNISEVHHSSSDSEVEGLDLQETESINKEEKKVSAKNAKQALPNIEKYVDLDFIEKVARKEQGKLLDVSAEYKGKQPIYKIQLQKGNVEWEGLFDAKTKKSLYSEEEYEHEEDGETYTFEDVKISPQKALQIAKKKAVGVPVSWQLEKDLAYRAPVYTVQLEKMVGNQIEETEVEVSSKSGKILAIDKEVEYQEELED